MSSQSISTDANFTPGMWIQFHGFVVDKRWNGVTGFLWATHGEKRWTVYVPSLVSATDDGLYHILSKNLAPLPAKTAGEIREETWVQAFGCTDKNGFSVPDGLAGYVVCKRANRWLVRFPTMHMEAEDGSVPALGIPEKFLRSVPLIAPRLVRKGFVAAAVACLEDKATGDSARPAGRPSLDFMTPGGSQTHERSRRADTHPSQEREPMIRGSQLAISALDVFD